jgi:hypothetical protein
VKPSICCFLGAGYSRVAGVPLARELFEPGIHVLALSQESERHFELLLDDFRHWRQSHSNAHSEQYMSELYFSQPDLGRPAWKWAVEYLGAVIASAGTPPASFNRDPRYSNRVNRPSRNKIHASFWSVVTQRASRVSVVTTNYDLLIERCLRGHLKIPAW